MIDAIVFLAVILPVAHLIVFLISSLGKVLLGNDVRLF